MQGKYVRAMCSVMRFENGKKVKVKVNGYEIDFGVYL